MPTPVTMNLLNPKIVATPKQVTHVTMKNSGALTNGRVSMNIKGLRDAKSCGSCGGAR